MSIRFWAVVLVDSCCWRYDGTTHCPGEPAGPARSICMAPTRSTFSAKPHANNLNRVCVLRFSFTMRPQAGQVLLVFCGTTQMSQPPFQASLSSSCLRNSNHPWPRRERFNRDLARSFLPGASLVPDADLDISLILKSSIHTAGWGIWQCPGRSRRKRRMDVLVRQLPARSESRQTNDPRLDTVTFPGVASISRLLINRTLPLLGRKTRAPSSFKPCGYQKESMPWPFFLNRGDRCGFFLSNATLGVLSRNPMVCCRVCDCAPANQIVSSSFFQPVRVHQRAAWLRTFSPALRHSSVKQGLCSRRTGSSRPVPGTIAADLV
jgi:hypothetical protein